MSTKDSDIKWAIDDQQLQLLYSTVSASITSVNAVETDELKNKIKKYKESMNSLINIFFTNKIPLSFLTIPMIALINKILLSKDPIGTLADLKPYGVNENIDKLIPYINTLHALCQEEIFKSAICIVQDHFMTDCIIKAEAPMCNLRRQLYNLRQEFEQAQPQKSPVAGGTNNASLIKKAELEIKKIESKMQHESKKTKKIKDFCDSFKVPFK